MRASLPLAFLLATVSAAGASPGPRISPGDAGRYRGQLVTLVGRVSAVERHAHYVAVRVGTGPGVPVLVVGSAEPRFGRGLGDLRGRPVEVTGFVSPVGTPLALDLDDPGALVVDPAPAELRALREHVSAVQTEVERLEGRLPPARLQLVTYGPSRRPDPIPLYASLSVVLGRRGTPDQFEWTASGPVLHYGFERWTFDDHGQLVDVRRP
jgi:hypothetical protein